MYNKLSFNSRFSQPHSHPALKSKVDTHILYHELLYVPFIYKYIHNIHSTCLRANAVYGVAIILKICTMLLLSYKNTIIDNMNVTVHAKLYHFH